jgi:hypothetical protein
MKLTIVNYSYANAIGSSLKQPLFKLVCNIAIASSPKEWESRAKRVAKVAFHCLVAVLFVIPAGFAWVTGKSIAYFSKSQIDHEGLHLVAPAIQIPEEESELASIDIRMLTAQFDALNLPDKRPSDQTSRKQCLSRLCEWTATANNNLYPDAPQKRALFCAQLTLFLRGIIKKLESASADQKKDILMELAEASTRCYPTWLEVSGRLFAELNGQAETVQVKLLRFLQDYKESIILDFCQNQVDLQWHALNYVRNILGEELGLNTDLNHHDPYAGDKDAVFGKGLTKWLFLQKYENVNRLISAVQTRINQDCDVSYYDCLVQTVKDRGIEDPNDYVATHFYSEDGLKLNESGVNLMLRTLGVIK